MHVKRIRTFPASNLVVSNLTEKFLVWFFVKMFFKKRKGKYIVIKKTMSKREVGVSIQ